MNIGQLVKWRNPLWGGRTRGTATAAIWDVIWPNGNNKPKRSAGLCSLFPPWIRFARRILTLMAKDARRVVEPWMWDTPLPDGNVWVRRRRRARKGLLQYLICWEGGDRRMEDQPEEERTYFIPDWTLSSSGTIRNSRRQNLVLITAATTWSDSK